MKKKKQPEYYKNTQQWYKNKNCPGKINCYCYTCVFPYVSLNRVLVHYL